MEVTVEENTDKEIEKASPYFSVSAIKFIIMSVGTFGVYDLYWFYKNWCHIKQKDNLHILPFWRAFFAPLWSYSAFNRIQEEINEREIPLRIHATLFAVLYFVIQMSLNLSDPYWLISIFSFLLVLPANKATTQINQKINADFVQNNKIEGWNWLAVVVGLPFMALAVIGSLQTL